MSSALSEANVPEDAASEDEGVPNVGGGNVLTVDIHAGVGGVGEYVVVGGPELRDVVLQRATIHMDEPEGSEGPAEQGTLLTAVMREEELQAYRLRP